MYTCRMINNNCGFESSETAWSLDLHVRLTACTSGAHERILFKQNQQCVKFKNDAKKIIKKDHQPKIWLILFVRWSWLIFHIFPGLRAIRFMSNNAVICVQFHSQSNTRSINVQWTMGFWMKIQCHCPLLSKYANSK